MTEARIQQCAWTEWMRVTRAAARYVLAGAITLGPIGVTSLAYALDTPAAPVVTQHESDVTHRERKALHRYLDAHPRMARALRKDPSLVNTPEFLTKHPGLQKFLAGHPDIAKTLQDNPDILARRHGCGQRHAHNKTCEHKHRKATSAPTS